METLQEAIRWKISVKEFLDEFKEIKEDGDIFSEISYSAVDDIFAKHERHLSLDDYKYFLDAAKIAIKNIESLNSLDRELSKNIDTEIYYIIVDVFGKDKAALEERAAEMIAYDKQHSVSGDRFSKAQKNDVNCANFLEALIRSYFEDKLLDIKTKMKKSINRINDMRSDDKEEAKNWLAQHTTNIKLSFPENDEDTYLVNDAEQAKLGLEKADALNNDRNNLWINWLNDFKTKCPEARENVDYKLRKTSAENDIHKELWRPAGEITFDVELNEAPEAVKSMISRAISQSKENEKHIEEILNGNKVSIFGFVYYVVCSLFNGDINFYKNYNFSDKLITDYIK